MIQQPSYLRYLEAAKQAELAEQLRVKGYHVETDKTVDDLCFDLVATNGKKALAYDIKSVGSPRFSKDALAKRQESARKKGYEFHIVLVNPPVRVKVEVDALAAKLLTAIENRSMPDLELIAGQASVDRLVDIEVSEIKVGNAGVQVKGSGTAEVTLQYGGNSDGVSLDDSYPFTFSARLSMDNEIEALEEFQINVDSFYGLEESR